MPTDVKKNQKPSLIPIALFYFNLGNLFVDLGLYFGNPQTYIQNITFNLILDIILCLVFLFTSSKFATYWEGLE